MNGLQLTVSMTIATDHSVSDCAAAQFQYGDQSSPDANRLRIVGGTFSFANVPNSQHYALSKALKLAVFTRLSMMLEQETLASFGAELHFPENKRPNITPYFLNETIDQKLDEPKPRQRGSIASGLLSFLSRKTETFLQRTTSFTPTHAAKPRSQDFGRSHSLQQHLAWIPPPRPSEEGVAGRLRRLSMISSSGRSSMSKAPEDEFEHLPPYSAAVKRVEKYRDLLSTSLGVTLLPPPLLVSLSKKESKKSSRRLKGDERAGLGSILGWEGRTSKGKSLTGVKGFTRQQAISMLFSKHVPVTGSPPAQPSEISTNSAVAESSAASNPTPTPSRMKRCGQAQMVTYRYYARDETLDKPLGTAIMDFCSSATLPCLRSGCTFKRGEHERRWIHSGVRITANIKCDQTVPHDEDGITVWSSCIECDAQTNKGELSNGAW